MKVTRCHLCGSDNLAKILDLGFHPLADLFLKAPQLSGKETKYPLSVLLCKSCGHAMNSYVVPPEIRYQENDYSYDSGNSKIAIEHFKSMADEVSKRVGLTKGDLVVDIGSNVGTLLTAFKAFGAKIQGVDPATNIAALARKNGVPTINDFFNASSAASIAKKGKAKVITMTNAFNHVADLDAFMKAILKILDKKGSFVIELPYSLQILRKRHFDVVYLEHVSYVAVKPLVQYFKKFDLSITHVEENDYMSGSIRFFVGKGEESIFVKKQIELEETCGLYNEKTWSEFSKQIRNCKLNLLRELVEARSKGAKVVAIGAAAKGNTLLNYCGIDKTYIDFATDASPLKIGKYTPGSHIPIFSDDKIDASVTHALILPWNIADFLKKKISARHPNLTFITPHVVEI